MEVWVRACLRSAYYRSLLGDLWVGYWVRNWGYLEAVYKSRYLEGVAMEAEMQVVFWVAWAQVGTECHRVYSPIQHHMHFRVRVNLMLFLLLSPLLNTLKN